MITEIKDALSDPEESTEAAARIIRNGGLVAFPTETVYGLGADGLNGNAVSSIFRAKGRPSDNPLILHVHTKEQALSLWRTLPEIAYRLMDTFWPGPLTIISEKADIIPNEVTAGLDTVAVRMPSNRIAALMIEKSKTPIAAPSANLSGKPSPTTAKHVYEDMNGRIPMILDGGDCKYGVESTVVSVVGEPMVLRPGAITAEMLAAVIGSIKVAPSILKPMANGEIAASPGMKYKHYAPNAEVIVVSGEPEAAANKINRLYETALSEGKRPSIAATVQTKLFYNDKECVILGDRKHPESMCATLFTSMRDLDNRSDVIFAEGIPIKDAGMAYMNRLLRAAGFHVINV